MAFCIVDIASIKLSGSSFNEVDEVSEPDEDVDPDVGCCPGIFWTCSSIMATIDALSFDDIMAAAEASMRGASRAWAKEYDRSRATVSFSA
jgi:hypothetical protein